MLFFNIREIKYIQSIKQSKMQIRIYFQMPPKCCVPGCKSNYRTSRHEGYVTVFGFPKNKSVRDKWIQNIGRDNWLPSRKAVVCVKHFIDSDVSRVETYKDKNGVIKQYSRRRPVLHPEAVPTIFPSFSSQRMNEIPEMCFGESPRTDLPPTLRERNEKGLMEIKENSYDKDELVSPESVILEPGGEESESESEEEEEEEEDDDDDDEGDDDSIFNYGSDPLDVDGYSSLLQYRKMLRKNVHLSQLGDLSAEESMEDIASWILDHSYVKTVPHDIASKSNENIEPEFGTRRNTGSRIESNTPRSAREIVHHTPDLKEGAVSNGEQPQCNPCISAERNACQKTFSMTKQLVYISWDSHVDTSQKKGSEELIVREKNGSSEKKCPSFENRPKNEIKLSEKPSSSPSNSVVHEKIGKEADENCNLSGVATESSEIVDKCDDKRKRHSQLEGMEISELSMLSSNTSGTTKFSNRESEGNESLDDGNILNTSDTKCDSSVENHNPSPKRSRICKNFEKQAQQIIIGALPDILKESINSTSEASDEGKVHKENKLQRLRTINHQKRGRGRGRKLIRKALPGRGGEDRDKKKTTFSSILSPSSTAETLPRRTSRRMTVPSKKMVGPNGKCVGINDSEKEEFGEGVKTLVHSSFSPRVVIERNLNLRSDQKTPQSVSDQSGDSLPFSPSEIEESFTSIKDKHFVVNRKAFSDSRKGNSVLSKNTYSSVEPDSVIFTQQNNKDRCGMPVGLTSRRRGRSRGRGRFRQTTKRNVVFTKENVSLGINNQITETTAVVDPMELEENENALRVTRSSSEMKRRNEGNNSTEKDKKTAISERDSCDGRQKRKIALKNAELETCVASLTNISEFESTHENNRQFTEVGFTGYTTPMQLSSNVEISLGERKMLGRRGRRRRGRGLGAVASTSKLKLRNRGRGKTRGRLNYSFSSGKKAGMDNSKQNSVASPNRAIDEKSGFDDNAVLTVVQAASSNGPVDYEEDSVNKMNDSSVNVCNNGPIIVNVSSVRSQVDILNHVNMDLEFISGSSDDEEPVIMDIMSLSEESEELSSSEMVFCQAESHDLVTNANGEEESQFNRVDEENPDIAGPRENKYCNKVFPDPCPYCRMQFVDALMALTHTRNCLQSSTRSAMSCHVCDRLYVRIEDLNAHMKIHQKDSSQM